jgi:hypothetical protein
MCGQQHSPMLQPKMRLFNMLQMLSLCLFFSVGRDCCAARAHALTVVVLLLCCCRLIPPGVT